MTVDQIGVLVVDDNDDDAVLIGHSLTRAGLPVRVTRAETADEVTAALTGRRVDVVICDYNLPGVRAEEVLVQVREHDADLPFVLVSGQVGEETAADLMRAGARDFVLKDRLTRLAPAVQRELHEAAERRRHRRLEEQLRQSERLDSLGQLAGGIAHDFNNILAVISGYATMLTEELGPGHALHADALAIEQAAARGSGLTRQLLIFSGLEPSRPELLDLNVVATDMQRVLSRTLGEDVELSTMLSLNLPRITIDRSKLEQVIMNAAMNARAALPSGGRVTITTEVVRENGHVCLAVTDTGHGMPPEVAARAFEPFFTTKGRGRGTGLGLATAYGVIVDAGGTISLDSHPGQGTTLRICLPPAEVAAPVSTLVRRPAAASGSILVVEDEDGVRDIVARILRRAGYEVHAAADPAEALRLVHDGLRMDALLTDIIMPGMSGTQLAAELRKIRPALPVLFMSGYTSGPAPGGQELPADAPLLHKPFQSENLLNAVHAVLP
ncbi:response regulator [Actinoplanes sp. TRM 88003]|uniref:histidine kinase n=1 Tax=Paractinoplanes aksuensis TaxID=2939490 RepID=A0ABT1DRV5_9ACTN|nr:hybrid sensor histidine kinase/response regulator [Actinoplanes aksuensis]MCO8272811.1 response regulator [Actinoplanes aksuensis]